jgi:vacuolar-type H+-ATPase subunit H
MDDKTLGDIKFHQDVLAKDAGSPLFQIREKEMEISGRILSAKLQAETIVSEARRRALDLVKDAQGEADQLAKEHGAKVLADAEATIAGVKSEGKAEVEKMEQELAARRDAAAEYVVKLVTAVQGL